ncbi:MAG: hypothetical protein Q9O62_02700 [Ardenticatenia bacterium]|nr:hypothetical protein [Ardenticatenia bacterium]
MEPCPICEERRPEDAHFANAECTNCGRYVCYDHAIRVQRGSFLCLVCYEADEEFYRQHRRLIQRPRYNVPVHPTNIPTHAADVSGNRLVPPDGGACWPVFGSGWGGETAEQRDSRVARGRTHELVACGSCGHMGWE